MYHLECETLVFLRHLTLLYVTFFLKILLQLLKSFRWCKNFLCQYYLFSSIFITLLDFLTFLCYKETNAVSFQSQIDPSEKTAFKKPTLIRFKECQVCLCEKILSDTLREPRSVDFFPIWKYQEEIYSTLPKKLIIKRGFWSF